MLTLWMFGAAFASSASGARRLSRSSRTDDADPLTRQAAPTARARAATAGVRPRPARLPGVEGGVESHAQNLYPLPRRPRL